MSQQKKTMKKRCSYNRKQKHSSRVWNISKAAPHEVSSHTKIYIWPYWAALLDVNGRTSGALEKTSKCMHDMHISLQKKTKHGWPLGSGVFLPISCGRMDSQHKSFWNVKGVHRWSTHIWPLQTKNAKNKRVRIFFFFFALYCTFSSLKAVCYDTVHSSDEKEKENEIIVLAPRSWDVTIFFC